MWTRRLVHCSTGTQSAPRHRGSTGRVEDTRSPPVRAAGLLADGRSSDPHPLTPHPPRARKLADTLKQPGEQTNTLRGRGGSDLRGAIQHVGTPGAVRGPSSE